MPGLYPHLLRRGAQLGIPARYVSGHYVRAEAQPAGHAWAEALVPDLGWVGFDPTNGISTTPAHVRVAVGLDYLDAAPVRGARRGGGTETMHVAGQRGRTGGAIAGPKSTQSGAVVIQHGQCRPRRNR